MLAKVVFNAVALLAASQAVSAHSWVEALFRMDSSGAFTGPVGYPIGYVDRNAPGFHDELAQNKILDTKSNPAVCKPKAGAYNNKISRLDATAGDLVALVYQENGHVTQPDLTPRPYRGGNVYVYGTLEHQDSDGINDVLNAWTPDGSGGNGKGRMLASHFYDDGQCYQDVVGNEIYDERSSAEGGKTRVHCQSDLQLPDDLPSEGTYTLMWVWDWPLIVDDKTNVTEIYTSCAEIQLGSVNAEAAVNAKVADTQFAQSAGISAGITSQLAHLIEATALGVGTNSPAAPAATSNPDSSSKPASNAPSSSTKKGGVKGVKTVTVTADPATVTEFTTVTVGAGGGNAQQSGPKTTSAQLTEQTTTQVAAPTSLVPVTKVEGFLKARTAKVTGQARRVAARRQ